MNFFIPCVPFKATHHAKRIVRAGRFLRLADKPELVAARHTYESLLMLYRPAKPLEGPIRLMIKFYFPHLKSHSKAQRLLGVFWKPTKPDCSNLAKTFEDCLCRMNFFADDGQVVLLEIYKYFSSLPGIDVTIEELKI